MIIILYVKIYKPNKCKPITYQDLDSKNSL